MFEPRCIAIYVIRIDFLILILAPVKVKVVNQIRVPEFMRALRTL